MTPILMLSIKRHPLKEIHNTRQKEYEPIQAHKRELNNNTHSKLLLVEVNPIKLPRITLKRKQ
jgi:hypothetical protein